MLAFLGSHCKDHSVEKKHASGSEKEMETRGECTLRYAGSCRPNPGHGGIGFVIKNNDDNDWSRCSVVEEFSAYVNDCFRLGSNGAHYKALIAGLQHALSRGITHITAIGHWEGLINQVERKWIVDKPWLKRYCNRVRELSSQFKSCKMRHIYSRDNLDARSLARAGFNNTFVDQRNDAEREILQRCRDPKSAKKYVLEQRCNGYHRTKYILDIIECRLPESYAAVRKLCINIRYKLGMGWIRNNNRVWASLLGLY